MQKHSLVINRHMAKGNSNKPASGGAKGGPRPTDANRFPGGNWPSKVPGGKSGGNRGQGPKA
ncbi:hypothetical protein SAMN05216205_3117 [Pseudomonas mohnii]|uniref:Uncharacterized protein n=1 Tax=Pseudomonas mohnii TaxID=395600 RepID=A0ABY0Y160_9PSED|nr:hypothetical protein SAMN05216205_3117 [Pseudomonas mohnii]